MRLLAILLLSAAVSAAPREWGDSTRDVYIDGKLDRRAQTLVTSSPRMLAVVCGEEVMLLDPEAGTASAISKSSFTFSADRTSATSDPDLKPTADGAVVRPDPATYYATLNGGRSLVLAAHQSKAGAMTIEELWETVPVWKSIAEHYQPDAAAVERLRAIGEPVELEIVFATWCGDSKQYVPRLLKSIEAANNPNIRVELTGIGPEFLEPMSVVQGDNITNVPTVIVRNDDAREIGRVVETPACPTMEGDVADILGGAPKPHPGRIERGPLVTSGTYVLRDARRRDKGTESFEIYERPGGGKVVHSVIAKRDGTSVETWASIDDKNVPRYVEITSRGATTTRTRFRGDGKTFTAHSRGTPGGIVDQTMVMPAALITPATVTYAWARDAVQVYEVPESGIGTMRSVTFEVADGDVPKIVRFEDGSSRVLRRR
jgi:thiol-disulfide isomerase/thioredoxin